MSASTPTPPPNPGISLLIPAYQAANHLPRLLAQARAQSRPFAEILVCDDASRDGTAEVAAAAGARVIRHPRNRGISAARNTLLQAATAQFLHFHDADDEIDPEFNERLVRAADDHTAVFCDYATRASTGSATTIRCNPAAYDGDWVRFFLRHLVHCDCMLLPKAALPPSLQFDESMRQAEDRLFNIELALTGVSFRYVPGVYATVIAHDSSTTARSGVAGHLTHELRLYERLAERLPARHRVEAGEMLLGPLFGMIFHGMKAEARRAVALAVTLGARDYRGDSKLVRLLCRHLGLRTTARLMVLRASLTR